METVKFDFKVEKIKVEITNRSIREVKLSDDEFVGINITIKGPSESSFLGYFAKYLIDEEASIEVTLKIPEKSQKNITEYGEEEARAEALEL